MVHPTLRRTMLCCLVVFLSACSSERSGERIACHVVHEGWLSGGGYTFAIHVMNGDGRERVEIGEGSYPGWSPDGDKLVFVGGDDESLQAFDRESGETALLAYIGAFVNHPAWSPDGESIAFVRAETAVGGSIWVMDADGSNIRQLTEYELGSCLGPPSWSPDSTRIAFSMSPDCTVEEPRSDIYVMSNDGSNVTRLTDGKGGYWDPVWSPQADRIAFAQYHGAESGIYVINADGSQQTRLGRGRPYGWSPDGTRIYFRLPRFEPDDHLWTIDSDGANRRRLFRLNCEEPSWSPVVEE